MVMSEMFLYHRQLFLGSKRRTFVGCRHIVYSSHTCNSVVLTEFLEEINSIIVVKPS